MTLDPYQPLDWPDEPLSPDADRGRNSLVSQSRPVTQARVRYDLAMTDSSVYAALNQLRLRRLVSRLTGKRYMAVARHQSPENAA